jgi:hypothetical protein
LTTLPVARSVLALPPFWRRLWLRLWESSRALTLSVILYAFLFLCALVLSRVDTRTVVGAPVWIKPMKFALSALLYCGTLAWMLSYVEGRRWLVRLVAGLTALGLLVEIMIITFQAGRGVRSHFNLSTPFDATLFSVMGSVIIVIWAMNLLAACLLLRQRLPDAAMAWALRLGLAVTFVGAGSGYLMIGPTPRQAEARTAGAIVPFIGAHNVGVEDGGPGIPLTGWSTEGGDLRVAHFVGLHALQALPLAGLLVNRHYRWRLSERRRVALVWVAGMGYLGLTLLLIGQALRGQSIIAPGAATLAILASLLLAGLGAAVVIARQT